MYIFLFAYYGPCDSGHHFMQIIADHETEARALYDLDQFWKLESCFELKHLYDAEIVWDFEYDNPNYEG